MDIKDVENLARLSRLALSDEEKQGMLKDLDSILEYVKVIEKVEVKEAKPLQDIYNAWREDEPEVREFSRELILEQFPEEQDGFLKVKKIL